jgi:hypothetical protein
VFSDCNYTVTSPVVSYEEEDNVLPDKSIVKGAYVYSKLLILNTPVIVSSPIVPPLN